MKFTNFRWWWLGLLVAVVSLLLGVQAIADDDEALPEFVSRQDFTPPDNPEYVEECGSCHMAYPAGLLPARSWRRMLSRLDDHFGENAELDAPVAARITRWLEAHAADSVASGRAPHVARSLQGTTPLRFTTTRYFRRKHHEIPERMVRNNPDVVSFSRCEACHPRAEKGNFDEHAVRIPGYGRWDD